MSHIFVLGNATVDLTLVLPVWPRAGETVLAERLIRGAGGKGLNQAHAARQAGAQVTLCAPVGQDADGVFLRETVGDSHTARWRTCAAPTDVSTIWVGADGENMIASSAQCAHAIDAAEVAGLLEGIAGGDILIMQGNLGAAATVAASRHARGAGARVVLNTAPIVWDMTAAVALADVVVCNAPEVFAITGLSGAGAARAVAACGPAVMLTLGADGALVAEGEAVTEIAAPPVKAVDTSGAGDVAVGYLAAALLGGAPLADAARLAVRAASISVTRPGTRSSCPSRSEVDRHGEGKRCLPMTLVCEGGHARGETHPPKQEPGADPHPVQQEREKP